MTRAWATVRWALAATLVGGSLVALVATAWRMPGSHVMRVPFEVWYGNWRAVLLVAGVFMSQALIAAGIGLLVLGWVTVYRGRDRLVTDGIYRRLRHPQYLGLILTVIGFNIQWPTLPTVLMAPILIAMYVRLARREDLELATFFGETYLEWAARTPAFIPWGRGRVDPELRARLAATAGGVVPAVSGLRR